MDWFSWLSKTGLEPSLVYDYGLTFARNELEQDDMFYFNHEFLQSMGIAVAKHRLEILKLAAKEKGSKRPRSVTKLMVAIKKTKRSLSNYVRSLIHREESSALVVVPERPSNSFGTRWKSAVMMKRNKKLMVAKQERLFLTNGSPAVFPVPPGLDGCSSPVVYHFQKEEKVDGDDDNDNDDDDDGYWSAAVEEIKWDSMFQDLKPN